MGGAWVFPGGAVDAHEGEGDAAHRAAAVREVEEEVGHHAPRSRRRSSPFARWITPPEVSDPLRHLVLPRRGARRRRGRDRRAGDRRRALVRAGARARGLRGGRAADGLPDDQEPRDARALRHAPTRCSSGPRRTRSSRVAAARRGPRRDGADRPRRCLTADRRRHRARRARSAARSCARSSAAATSARVLGHGAAAVRSRATLGLRKTEYRQGDVLDRAAVDDARRRGRRARPPRVHHPRRPRRDAPRQPHRLAQRVRSAARNVQAARLHVVGRRLRLPRRQPAAADRGRPAARQRALLLLRAEGRARGGARRGAAGRRRGLRAAPVHRRRARRADAPARAPAAPGCRSPIPPVLPDPGTPFQLVHHDDVAQRARGRHPRRRARPAPTTSRATGRSRSATSPARSAGYSIAGPRAAGGRRRARRGRCR